MWDAERCKASNAAYNRIHALIDELNGGIGHAEVDRRLELGQSLPPLDADGLNRLLDFATNCLFTYKKAISYLAEAAKAGRIESSLKYVVVRQFMVLAEYQMPEDYPKHNGRPETRNEYYAAVKVWDEQDPERSFRVSCDEDRAGRALQYLPLMGREARIAIPLMYSSPDPGRFLWGIICGDDEILDTLEAFAAQDEARLKGESDQGPTGPPA